MRAIVFVLAFALSAASALAQTRTARALDIYVVDVEGGNATLFVSPSGESLLIDTGNTGAGAVRDAERIMAAARDAGLKQIDNLIITHWHGDHFGGLAELAARIPIRNFIDHGPNVQPAEAVDEFLQKTYPTLYSKAKHVVAKPGDKIAVAGLDVRVVTSAGETIKTPLPGAGRPPGLEDLWQIHFSLLSGQEYTVPGLFIANVVDQQQATMPVAAIPLPPPGPGAPPAPAHNGTAYWIKVSAQTDGSFTVTNARNGFSKTYSVNSRVGTN